MVSDGSRIAFVRRHISGPPGRSNLNEEIYVVRADGSGPHRLTRHAGEDTSPAWSPDGSSIAFVRRTARAGLDLYVMDGDGRRLRRLTRLKDFLADPAWSPDGRTVLVGAADAGNGGRILALDLRTDQIRRLSPPRQTYTRPDWSSRGDRIAFVKVTHCGGSCDLTDAWVMRRDGRGAHELAKDAVHVAWSQAGGLLLLDSGTVDVVRADARAAPSSLRSRVHTTRPRTGSRDARARERRAPTAFLAVRPTSFCAAWEGTTRFAVDAAATVSSAAAAAIGSTRGTAPSMCSAAERDATPSWRIRAIWSAQTARSSAGGAADGRLALVLSQLS